MKGKRITDFLKNIVRGGKEREKREENGRVCGKEKEAVFFFFFWIKVFYNTSYTSLENLNLVSIYTCVVPLSINTNDIWINNI